MFGKSDRSAGKAAFIFFSDRNACHNNGSSLIENIAFSAGKRNVIFVDMTVEIGSRFDVFTDQSAPFAVGVILNVERRLMGLGKVDVGNNKFVLHAGSIVFTVSIGNDFLKESCLTQTPLSATRV